MGPGLVYLEKPNTAKHSIDGENSNLIFGASCMQGWRINMEDAHIALTNFGGDPNACLFAVFDGHGGREVAEFSSRHLPEELFRNPNYEKGNIEKALIESFLKIDQLLDSAFGTKEIAEISHENVGTLTESPSRKNLFSPGEEGPEMKGCTANVVLIKGGVVYCANIGDSRGVLARKGVAKDLSIDHKPDNDGEKRRIINAGGSVMEGRVDGNLNLSRAFGDLRYKRNKSLGPESQMITSYPEIQKVPITEDMDFIVMGCDGIYETKTSQEIIDFFYGGFKSDSIGTPKKITQHIERFLDSVISEDYMKTAGSGCDNMSCIVIKFKKS